MTFNVSVYNQCHTTTCTSDHCGGGGGGTRGGTPGGGLGGGGPEGGTGMSPLVPFIGGGMP